ncbi:hypothetical protein OLCHANIL_00094 [Vibrio phage V05]|nr:hypothetical protein OLCHANIL_00094 [Vibrio phage V05]WOL24767.1 hypothetical protein [Vibrio phage PG216]
MIYSLSPVLWSFQDVERETGLRIWEEMIPNVEGTGIRLFAAKYNQFVFDAVHPKVPLCDHFNVLPPLDATINFHSNSYTIVIITEDSFDVLFSERASERTIADVERIINDAAESWNEHRLCTHEQRYTIEWCSAIQDYIINTVTFDRKWS